MKLNKKHFNIRTIVAIIVSVLAIIFIYIQRVTILNSFKALQSADWLLVIIAILAYIVTVLSAGAIIYNLRLIKKLRYKDVLIIQISTLFLGRITPASVGGLAAMGRLLFTQGHSPVQAGTVIGAGGIATFVGNVLLTLVAILLSLQTASLTIPTVPSFIIYVILLGFVIASLLMLNKKLRYKVNKIFKEIITTLKSYKNRKKSLLLAVFFGGLVTLFFALTLMLVAKSLGVNLSLFVAILTISLGSLGVAVTPLPGGVVGAEAVLATTMVQFGVASEVALAIAFVYRLIIFWLPLVPGFIASQYALKKQLL
jgi:uncharacterized membrane protein YbhN (UPF0104 family)